MKIDLNIRTTHWDRLGNGGLNFTEPGVGAVPLGIPAAVPSGLRAELRSKGPMRPDAPTS